MDNPPVNSPHIDYYALLNVARNASSEDIKKVYRNLCLTYHPDRHLDPVHKQQAQDKFTAITAAYETLSDPSKRVLYDTYGLEGLQSGWELANRVKNPEEVREAFERLRRKTDERSLAERLNQKGFFKLELDAQNLYNKRTNRLIMPSISSMYLSQTSRFKMTSKDTVHVSAQLGTGVAFGNGALALAYQHMMSEHTSFYSTYRITDTNKSHVSLGWNQSLSKVMTAQLETTLIDLRPAYATLSLTRLLAEHTLGTLAWTAGTLNAIKFNVTRAVNDRNPLSLEVNINPTSILHSWTQDEHTYTREYTRYANLGDVDVCLSKILKVSKRSVVKVAAKAGVSNGVGAEATVLRRMGHFAKFGMSVDIASRKGITVSGIFHRGSYKFEVPVLFTPEVSPWSLLAATAFPLALIMMTKILVITPLDALKQRRKREARRKQNAEAMKEAKRSAEADVRLMTPTVLKKKAQEEAKAGLVIVEARYGKIMDPQTGKLRMMDEDDEEGYMVVDVTIPMQYLVEDSRLLLQPSPKFGLLGFYDPAIGEDKELLVRYMFKGRMHQVLVQDDDALAIPLRSHLIPSGDDQ
eukprot:TRINITY_DN13398_c0_g1_i1.p1 TRINITY_DN13398_c0_g1~~TRINITY_DN13398_c0_g1_i1.p1  ORF type:complete len:601 (-),score=128.13 TRINITY_DN13398_c0_g1_i1:16-1755(-)